MLIVEACEAYGERWLALGVVDTGIAADNPARCFMRSPGPIPTRRQNMAAPASRSHLLVASARMGDRIEVESAEGAGSKFTDRISAVAGAPQLKESAPAPDIERRAT